MLGYAQQIYSAIKGREKPQKVPGSLFWQEDAFGITGVDFDLLINETHGMEFDVSEHAIENGDTVSDNVRRRLRKVTIVGLFTNHPIAGKSTNWINGQGYVDKEGSKITYNNTPMSQNVSRDEKWENLKAVASARKAVKLVAALEVYDSMVITSLRASRGPEDGEAIRFEMELTEVKSIDLVKASYQSGTYKPKTQKIATDRAMSPENNNGNVSAEEMAVDVASINNGQFGY